MHKTPIPIQEFIDFSRRVREYSYSNVLLGLQSLRLTFRYRGGPTLVSVSLRLCHVDGVLSTDPLENTSFVLLSWDQSISGLFELAGLALEGHSNDPVLKSEIAEFIVRELIEPTYLSKVIPTQS